MAEGMRILHGVDIVDIQRIEDCVKRYGDRFLGRFFTRKELDYSFARKNPYIHLAGRFASKEAGVKALAPLKRAYLSQFEVLIKDDKSLSLVFKPSPELKGVLSISHTNKLAVASVIFVL